MERPPLILVNGLLLAEPKRRLALDARYAEAVIAAGGVPVAFPPFGGPAALERALDAVDGVLLTGGDDFDTARLGLGPTHPSADVTPLEKQDLDLSLVRSVLARDLPVLGICYGMQCLGLAGGAQLLQHLPEQRPEVGDHTGGVRHDVRPAEGSKLAALLGVDPLEVVSRHHQALTAVPAPWVVNAHAEHELVEGLERPDLRFALGVQWHPELSPPDSPHGRLFEGLIQAAQQYHAAVSDMNRP